MERIEPIQFFLASLASKSSRTTYCFDKCIKKEEITNELSRDQERCLGIQSVIKETALKSIPKPLNSQTFDQISSMILLIHFYKTNILLNYNRPMRSSNSQQRNLQTQSSKNSKTQIGRVPPLERTKLNTQTTMRKQETKNTLPPKLPSKVSYDVEVNMTVSKIFQAKQGLQLLKKRMNRAVSSREQSSQQNTKVDENTNYQPPMKKHVSKPQKQIEQLSSQIIKAPNSKNNRPELKEKSGAQISKTAKQIEIQKEEVTNQLDDRPIAKNTDFMELLQKEMQKEKSINQALNSKPLPKNKIVDDNGNQVILQQCHMGCGRNFHPDVLHKHQKVCRKVFQSKRKQFDSSAFRQPEAEGFKPTPSTHTKIPEKPKTKGVPKWKLESAQLRVGIKQGKQQALSKQDQKMLQLQQEGLKPCQYCGRKFNENAALKHIPFCQKKSKEMSKNAFGKRR